MAIYIHFFRDSNFRKIRFSKVFEFFESIRFKIYYTDDEVQIVIAMMILNLPIVT